MLKQRTINTRRNLGEEDEGGLVTVAAFGAQKTVEPGKSVSETLAELGWNPQPYQSVRVGGEEIRELHQRRLRAGEVLTLTSRVVGG